MKTIIKHLLLILTISLPAISQANHIPLDKSSGTDQAFTTRLFYLHKNWTALTEFTAVNDFEAQQYRSILLGGYYRFGANFRGGLFYKKQYGFRHDEDWVQDPVVSWKWLNTNNRAENLVIADLSPKIMIPFLPGDAWSLDFKTRFEHNFFNGNQNLRLMPTLTYYWIRDDKAFLNFYFQLDQALALNHGRDLIPERWTYLGLLYNLNASWQFGISAARKTLSWSSTTDFKNLTGETYSTSNTGYSAGLLIIYKFEN